MTENKNTDLLGQPGSGHETRNEQDEADRTEQVKAELQRAVKARQKARQQRQLGFALAIALFLWASFDPGCGRRDDGNDCRKAEVSGYANSIG